jgi:hypothetical protein
MGCEKEISICLVCKASAPVHLQTGTRHKAGVVPQIIPLEENMNYEQRKQKGVVDR